MSVDPLMWVVVEEAGEGLAAGMEDRVPGEDCGCDGTSPPGVAGDGWGG